VLQHIAMCMVLPIMPVSNDDYRNFIFREINIYVFSWTEWVFPRKTNHCNAVRSWRVPL